MKSFRSQTSGRGNCWHGLLRWDVNRPFLTLVAAYGQDMRRILAARVLDESELELEEQEFWSKVVQHAGKYVEGSPVKHWLAVIARNQALNAQRRLNNRMKVVLFRAEMASRMRDDKEDDDLERSEDRAARLIFRHYIEGASYKQMEAEEHTPTPICALW